MKIPQLGFEKIVEELSKLTTSSIGKKLAEEISPQADLHSIRYKLEKVTEMRQILDTEKQFPIRGVKDITSSLKKAKVVGGMILTEEFLEIVRTLQATRAIKVFFKNASPKFPKLQNLVRDLFPIPELEKEILKIVDEITGTVKDSASPKLQKLRNQIRTEQNRIRSKIAGILSKMQTEGFTEAENFVLRDEKLVIPLKTEFKRKLAGAVVDYSQTGSTVFVEPLETIEISNTVRRLLIEEKAEVEKILIELTGFVRREIPTLASNLEVLAELDFIFAKGRLSQKLKGNAPNLTKEKNFLLREARHPILALRDYDSVVPLELELTEKDVTLIITGPNAGGKTVALKTIGLCALMVQSGLHVPVYEKSIFPIFDKIFVEIGDSQSIENDLSTFSSHVSHLKEIYEEFSEKSLILIDEIMSGTDPNEGSALSMSLLESFTQTKAFTVGTTHHGSLKAFAYETEGIQNGSMEFDEENLQPTYRFRAGIPGSSYAFEIAKRFGFAESVVERAKDFVGEDKVSLENLISELNNKLKATSDTKRELEIKLSEQKAFLSLYKQRSEKLAQEKKIIKQKAAEESAKILADANSAVELAIKEIREKKADKEVVKQAREIVEEQKQKVNKILKETKKKDEFIPSAKPLELGSTVKIKTTGLIGKIVSEPNSKGKVMVETDFSKITIKLTDLERIKAPKTQKVVSVKVNRTSDTKYSSELDIRGFYADDAYPAVDKFLYLALEKGLKTVTIIHGKGTGALKSKVADYLKTHPCVRTARFGNWDEGSGGTTIVEIS